jgi:hypothetical protein
MRARRAGGWTAVLALCFAAFARGETPGIDGALPPEEVAVSVVPARERILLGNDQELTVAIDVSGPGAQSFEPLRAFASVGTLEMPRQTAPARFTARYLPPSDRFPEVALLAVELGSGGSRARGFARVLLDGSTSVPFHTTPGASVTMRVGDRVFGPVAADHQGHVDIPVEVPPGVRQGQARAVDRSGAMRETDVDLQLPAFPRVLVLAPPWFEVGSFNEVFAFAVNPDGTPVAGPALSLTSAGGLAHPVGPGPSGEARFVFEAPRRIGSGAVALTATAAGEPPAHADVAVPLRAGTPVDLDITPAASKLVVGDPRTIRAAVSARDRFDNPTSAAGVGVTVDGRPVPIALLSDGRATFGIKPPAAYDGRDSIAVEARVGAEVRCIERIHLTGAEPTRLTLEIGASRVVADGKQGTELRVQAVDQNGTPTAVPGLSWDTPGGRIRRVRVPRDGEYLAEYIPRRAREPHRQTVGVMASDTLRAEGVVDVMPAPVRFVVGVRAGLFTNFGSNAGPATFVEGAAPLGIGGVRTFVGVAIGFLRGDITTAGVDRSGTARFETNQVPLLLIWRALFALPGDFEADLDADLGWSHAWTRVTASPGGSVAVEAATAGALALGAAAEVSYALKPGRLALGLRYLWVDLGRTSEGDTFVGNSAGLIGDLGYKITF